MDAVLFLGTTPFYQSILANQFTILTSHLLSTEHFILNYTKQPGLNAEEALKLFHDGQKASILKSIKCFMVNAKLDLFSF